MKIHVKQNKVMGIYETGRIEQPLKFKNVPLKRVTRSKYLRSWITDDARSDDDHYIRARVELAKVVI